MLNIQAGSISDDEDDVRREQILVELRRKRPEVSYGGPLIIPTASAHRMFISLECCCVLAADGGVYRQAGQASSSCSRPDCVLWAQIKWYTLKINDGLREYRKQARLEEKLQDQRDCREAEKQLHSEVHPESPTRSQQTTHVCMLPFTC